MYGRESKVLKSYLKRIHETASRGDAREESYYSVLKILLEEYAESTNRDIINTTFYLRELKRVNLKSKEKLTMQIIQIRHNLIASKSLCKKGDIYGKK